MLGPHAEVGIDAGPGEPVAQAAEPGRSRGPIRLRPAEAVRRGRRRREVGRVDRHLGHCAYFLTFFWCSAWVFAKALVFDPSFLATKKR